MTEEEKCVIKGLDSDINGNFKTVNLKSAAFDNEKNPN